MRLVEEGRVDLDAPVRTYLPGFRTADSDRSKRITVRHLLTHTSGFSTLHGNRRIGRTQAEGDVIQRLVRGLADVELSAAPGSRRSTPTPDLGWALLVGGGLAVFWAVLRSALLFRYSILHGRRDEAVATAAEGGS